MQLTLDLRAAMGIDICTVLAAPTLLLCFTACGAAQGNRPVEPPSAEALSSPEMILEASPVEASAPVLELQASAEEAANLLDAFDEQYRLDTMPLDTSAEAIARRTLVRYFQMDMDTQVLTRAEVLEAFSGMERSDQRDGVLTRAEFRASYHAQRMAAPGDERPEVQALMRGRDPWQCLVRVMDTDSDGALTRAELRTFLDTFGSRTLHL
ncbi:MAG: hypothetical protein ACI8QC_001050 [Planctomycetota bacterium]|jgi:hypothetical protein